MIVEWVPEAGSTNTELVHRVALSPLPSLTALVTTNQTAGRGRLGRTWSAPAGTTVACSVFVRADRGLGWLPLAAGLAMTRAVRRLVPDRDVALKWPNDVLIDGAKVSGLLGELVAGGAVIGAGLNLTMSESELPVPTATSLTLVGAEADGILDRALAAYLDSLEAIWRDFERAGFDAEVTLRADVTAVCGTLGRAVRVELPDGSTLLGDAVDLDSNGCLLVSDPRGRVHTIAAGDVTHVRHA